MPVTPAIVNPNVDPIIGGNITGRLIEQPGAELTDNEYGMDVLVKTYFAATLADAYKFAPKRGEKDKDLLSMICTNRSIRTGSGKTATVTATFKGVYDDKLPNVEVKGGWREATATMPLTSTFGGIAAGFLLLNDINVPNVATGGDSVVSNGEASITYRSPTTNFLYVLRKEPKEPMFAGQMLQAAMSVEVIDIRPAGIRNRPYGRLQIMTTDFEVEPVGAYWQCREVNQIQLLSASSHTISLQKAVSALNIKRYKGASVG